MNVQMYGTPFCPDCRAARKFLDAHGIAYSEINVDRDPAASAEVLRRVGKRAVPQLVIDGRMVPALRAGRGLLVDELHERLGILAPDGVSSYNQELAETARRGPVRSSP